MSVRKLKANAVAAAPLHRVVIIGAGFGGLSAAMGLAKGNVALTIIDRRNHHLFQPLLYQVATAGLSPADIAVPIRNLFSGNRNVRFILGEVTGVDTEAHHVHLGSRPVPYDTLIIATGAQSGYFGHDEWRDVAPGLKSIEDATAIRRNILLAFERAEASDDQAARARLLTFVVIGGGPTGVELAGAIAELALVVVAKDFVNIDPRDARIILIEAGPRVLPTFPEALSARAARYLVRLGVELKVNCRVTRCDADGVMIGDEAIATDTIIWGAGVMASPAVRWIGVEGDRAGRVRVLPDLTVPGASDIFVIGDTSAVEGPDGHPLPGLAPVAKQQGMYVARTIRARLAGRAAKPFRYRHGGNLATIGRGAAVVDFGRLRFTGTLAWFLWGGVHIAFLIGFRNRAAVLIDWLWAYVSFKRGARLITGGPMA